MSLEILHKGSLMTFIGDGRERCLGYLLDAKEKGVYEPNFGKVDVTSGDAQWHNTLLSAAEIKGLDEHCEVGQGGTFFFIHGKVQTWVGQLVSDKVALVNSRITFERNGRVYQGRLRKGEDCFFFRRLR